MNWKDIFKKYIALLNEIKTCQDQLTTEDLLIIDFYNLTHIPISDEESLIFQVFENTLLNELDLKELKVSNYQEFIIDGCSQPLFYLTFYWKYQNYKIEARFILNIKGNEFTVENCYALTVYENENIVYLNRENNKENGFIKKTLLSL